jgi:hypothetical protein
MTGLKAIPSNDASEFAASLRKGILLGAAVLVVVLPPAVSMLPRAKPAAAPAPAAASAPASQRPAAVSPAPRPGSVHVAQFGREKASRQVHEMANWVLRSGDHNNMSFVIVDKKDAKVFLFHPLGQLKAATPALLGAARGDDSVPGIGEKPLSQVLPEEKTTPAGRFIAELGMNTKGEDIVWVDYDVAVSMHRVRANVKAERRLERLASPTPADNRISFGCINLPVRFYETMLKPTVQAGATVIYVLPEARAMHEVFASFEQVHKPVKAVKTATLVQR